MTTFSRAYHAARNTPAPARPRTPILVILGRILAVLGAAAGRRLPRWATLRRAALTIGGLAALTVGAWTFADWAGWIVLGVSLLILEALA
ncbi:hypothetical protein J5X84_36195 [Streptosporangiaceae bacterium NEAU-GS5]|nr:hypothetical protein [Streptosporangiaceae bacterium NEAU-GS5]